MHHYTKEICLDLAAPGVTIALYIQCHIVRYTTNHILCQTRLSTLRIHAIFYICKQVPQVSHLRQEICHAQWTSFHPQ